MHTGSPALGSGGPELEFRAVPLICCLLVSCMTSGKLLNLQVTSLLFT